ncbi:hypothetical protein B5G52_15695 [Pseudoalteromonas sp. A601]|uniref:hypothetical protein n=1 Tax=Pseudoalteromonas sp. A601 TaxID=1967839 RepID=UPI000B3D4C85|nr:hypothetical protein [Pseudoalteromonas sp. A601]OUS70014.1 hypothetical protein B5G52_15695 [Pseudoalteromonas sp. A601]
MALVTRLFLFALCICSFSSAAKYSEAMCILYKQQMQQYSDDKSSRSYRNAKRDFDKNCSNPPVGKNTQQLLNQPEKTLSNESENIQTESALNIESLTNTVNPLDTVAQDEELKRKQTDKPVELEKLDITQEVAEPAQLPDQEVAQPQVAANTQLQQGSIEPVAAEEKITAPAKKFVAPPVVPVEESTSLMTPLLIIVLVLLIAGLVLYKLRMRKQTNELSSAEVKATPPEIKPNKKVDKPLIKPTSVPEQNLQNDEVAVAAKRTDVADTDTVKATQESINNDFAKPTFKSEHNFKEPEVRTFDPNAPLPGQKPQVEAYVTHKEPTDADELCLIQNPTGPSEVDSTKLEIDIKVQLEAESESDKSSLNRSSEPSTTQADELSVSQSEPNETQPAESAEKLADDENEIVKALSALNNELEAEKNTDNKEISEAADELHNTSSTQQQGASKNPFSNLSLDPTWDPNSTEKPKIEPKKKAPKSAQLIAAEERAKQLKTDDQ